MRNFMGFQRTICDCSLCVLNCQFIPGYLLPEDLIGIGRFLGYSDLTPFVEQNFLASPGALVAQAGRLYRIRTIVPARGENGWCKFFDGKLCTIHPVAPAGCAFFDVHQTKQRSDEISEHCLTKILAEWNHRETSLYRTVWHHLYEKRLLAPPPEECRERMREAMQPNNW